MNPVVIATNCLLQIIARRSPYRPIWDAFLDGRYDLCVSNEILDEYQEITFPAHPSLKKECRDEREAFWDCFPYWLV